MEIVMATVAMQVKHDKSENIKQFLSYMEQAAEQGVKLIVFPEQSLQGYLPSSAKLDFSAFDYQHANAETIPDGPSVQMIIKRAAQLKLFVVFGMTELDKEDYTRLYNTAVLVGPKGYIGKYRKVHLPNAEMHFYFAGDEFPVFQTEIGKIGLLICYDKIFPEAARTLALKGAEILIMPTAWSFENTQGKLDQDPLLISYHLYDQVRAMENQCFFISSNMVFRSGESTFLGHSHIVSPVGEFLADTGYREGLATAQVDVRKMILYARTRGCSGLNYLKDRHPETYGS